MQFRKDVNGLRAIAVIAVVLFHFNPLWLPGGFAGVDVFFVISGYLMTRIIFIKIEKDQFSIMDFYIARANRIIPALAVLCLVLSIFGWFVLAPIDYSVMGKHVASSMLFLSNIFYWRESGYFDAVSHEKWLLHTWSLSVEWQFYIIYPLILVAMRKFMSIKFMKIVLLSFTVLGFLFCIVATYKYPNPSYYLLPTRAWEMMVGGIAFLFPLAIKGKRKSFTQLLGLALIITSYFFVSKNTPWPGYLALLPVLGTFFVIQAEQDNSIITDNFLFQKIGAWSYSIYLWHWPFVVAIYYFSLNERFIFIGVILSVLLGYLSNRYVESIRFNNSFEKLIDYLRYKPLSMVVIIALLGVSIVLGGGFMSRSSSEYQDLVNVAKSSPLRSKCHISEYKSPELSCEYFGENITWASFGDSHSVEIAYALAEKLKENKLGLKHFSFSGCKPSYKEENDFAKCAKWYNETIDYILNDDNINNVVLNHRFTEALVGGESSIYPRIESKGISDETILMSKSIDELILDLSKSKDNVYVYYPIPELPRDIRLLVGLADMHGDSLVNIFGTTLDWYEKRNSFVIEHFDNANYPKNVHLLNPKDVFCDKTNCFAVRDGVPLYFDDDHPSIQAAYKLVELINTTEK